MRCYIPISESSLQKSPFNKYKRYAVIEMIWVVENKTSIIPQHWKPKKVIWLKMYEAIERNIKASRYKVTCKEEQCLQSNKPKTFK
ncbi:hypothetical protein CANARDRAFT_149987 [[Candida] arabinofermentans NRRL YB-2248]|uniref:Uncharacterized protein n=1 Tax=[Candida] arabinofermentans NRRL YB-2248 TaxID=983967 RepID=A0A1E4T2V7_9ASCO|nr:hypothetical protein CANARDRAFT_149987 [[Candida] arabinofermentans NRRL YB-2248]